MRSSAVLFRILAVAVGALLLSSCAAKRIQTVRIANDQIALKVPAVWTYQTWRGSTALELRRSRETPEIPVNGGHIMVFREKRRSRDEAVMRLGEIAAESKVPPTFLLIDGWPALERRETVTVPLPGEAEKSSDSNPKAVLVTTAIAADDVVVRLEASLPLGVSSSILTEVEKIGRSFTFIARPKAAQSKDYLQRLRSEKERPLVTTHPPAFPIGMKPDRRHTVPGMPSPAASSSNGELEVAASRDGQHVVVAGQFATTLFSDDGGLTFQGSPPPALPAMLTMSGNNGDPSIAIGASGRFYVAFLSTPGGACASSVLNSAPNSGANFTFVSNAVLCPLSGNPQCFPDQEHIAAAPNPSFTGNDQIYMVYRNFTGVFGGNCPLSNYNNPGPWITCSADNGKTWLPPAPVDAGDRARVTVGGDGFVWVVDRKGGWIVVSKFSSCETGLQGPQPGFPKNVVAVADPLCPVPGLDRCDGPSLSSAMITVDETDPTHIYIAFANSTSSANDDIVVADTTDAFETAPNNIRTATVSGAPAGRRFMPWVCTLGGSAEVTWYDRRSATPTNIDLTTFFRGSASVVGGALVSGAEVDVSGVSDPQCAPGFPCGADNANDINSCPRPHNDGTCHNASGTGSGFSCDRDLNACPAGESCQDNRGSGPPGCPKYGDYNGTACAAGHVFAAWASATPPPGLPPPTLPPGAKPPPTPPGTQPPPNIGLFVDAVNCGGIDQACCPGSTACLVPELSCGANGRCSAPTCGGLGQPCCNGNCAAPNGCSATTSMCVACPPAPKTLLDTTVGAGANCFGNTQVSVLGQDACDPGFTLGACSAFLNSELNGSTCSATPTAGCDCRVRVTTPADCSKSATCRVVITENPVEPIPVGCPGP